MNPPLKSHRTLHPARQPLIKRHEPRPSLKSKCGQIRVRPILRRRHIQPRQTSKAVIQRPCLIDKARTTVPKKRIVNRPCLPLRQYLRTHHRLCRQQPQQTHLCEPAEDRLLIHKRIKPLLSDQVVGMSHPCKRHPKFTSRKTVAELTEIQSDRRSARS